MRDEITPFLLDLLLLTPIVKNSCCEGSGDGKEDEPIAGREFGTNSWDPYDPLGLKLGVDQSILPIIRNAGLPSAFAVSIAGVVEGFPASTTGLASPAIFMAPLASPRRGVRSQLHATETKIFSSQISQLLHLVADMRQNK